MGSQTKCGCIIESLLEIPFRSRMLEDRIKIVKQGRPTADLSLTLKNASKGKRLFVRRFRKTLYDAVPWLCGCRAINKLFCWPCLMLSREENPWTTSGYNNLQNISKTAKTHQVSVPHITALKELKRFVRSFRKEVDSSLQSKPDDECDVEFFNLIVEKERIVFKHLARVAGVLEKLDFSLDDPKCPDSISDKCTEILRLVSKHDIDVRKFIIEKNCNLLPALKQLSHALADCMIDEIKWEVSETDFVTLILDGATDRFNTPYIATSLRYMKKNKCVVERFVRFSKKESVSASGVFEHVQEFLREFECASKVVAFTHNGAVTLYREHSKLKHNIQKLCPGAVFVHHPAYGLSNVIVQAVNHIAAVKLFFSSVSSIGNFFSLSPKFASALEEKIKQTHPLTGEIEWNDEVRLVETIHNHGGIFKDFFLSVIDYGSSWDSESVRAAKSFLIILKDLEFNFFLTTFATIFLRSEILFQLLMNKITEPRLCAKKIDEFFVLLRRIKSGFPAFWSSLTVINIRTTYDVRKNCMINTSDNQIKAYYNRIYLELLDCCISCIFERFENLEEMLFLCLLDNKQFKNHYISFDHKTVTSLTENYTNRFNFDKLKNELCAIYNDSEIRAVQDVHDYLFVHELDDVFSETFKLSKLMCTIPLNNNTPSASDNVKRYLKRQDKDLNVTCLLTIERGLLDELLEQEKFLEKVVDKFASKAGRSDLQFKGLPKDSSAESKGTPKSSSNFGLDSNLFMVATDSDMVVEVDPDAFGPPDTDVIEIDPLSQPGPSSRLEPDSSMLEDTPSGFRNEPDSPLVKIKQEYEDSNILSATVEKELNSFSKESPTCNIEDNLFQPPVLIKEEPVSSEEEEEL